ncbi:MAG: NAD(P)H-binding protein [Alphaproteobacteria bacterium]|jgi:uncharacterized protein YbjT (DUF2867 family)|nr:NAD(P)H-binding protein [Alphaproteobacteria bacterium]MDP6516525.1 NAD(P)H-binding protein [Alphaproteobacteria bacterium]
MADPADQDRRSVLVIGATGQIGIGVLREARRLGWRVAALRHRRPGAEEAGDAGVEWIDGDLALPGLDLGRLRAECVIFATGLWLLPAHLEALHGVGVRRLIAFSTSSVKGKRDSRSRFERDQTAAIAAAEAAVTTGCDRLGMAWTLLRPALIYGRGLDQNITVAARLIDRLGWYPISGPAQGLRQPVHADDLAAAALAAIDCAAARGRIYHLGGGETLTYRDMIGRLFDCLGRRRRLVPVPGLGVLAAAWGLLSGNPVLTADTVRRMNRDLAFDDGAAARDFAYAPRPFLAAGRADLGI